MRMKKIACGLFALAFGSGAMGFEIDTHARITQEAFRKSVLFSSVSSNEKLKQLGLLQSRAGRGIQQRASEEIFLGPDFLT
jgi:hypothetical protein